MYLLRSLSILVCGIVVTALAGCGGGGGGDKVVKMPDVSPAAGVVTYKDKPVEGAQVMLVSSASKQNLWALSGKSDATGKFEIETIVSGVRAKGAPVGEYTVTVLKQEATSAADAAAMQKAMEEKAKGSPGANDANLQMGPKSAIPAKYASEAQSDLKVTIEKAGNTKIELKLND